MHLRHGVVQPDVVHRWPPVLETYRLYNCACCGQQVQICRHCDRGNVYCTGECAAERRWASLRRASARYQQSYRGACLHAARHARWRARQVDKVTHQGSHPPLTARTVLAIVIALATHHAAAQPPQGHCHFCQRTLPAFARLGPLCGGP